MPEGQQQIDVEQAKISGQIEKEKQTGDQILSDSAYQDAFISKVDNFQTLPETEKLEQGPTEARSYYEQGSNEVTALLRRAADRGATLYREALAAKEPAPAPAPTPEKPKEEKPKTEKPKAKKTPDNLNDLESELRGNLNRYRENLQKMVEIEKKYQDINNQKELIDQTIKSRLALPAIMAEDLTEQLNQALNNSGELRRIVEQSPGLPKAYLAERQQGLKEIINFLGEKKLIIAFYKEIFQSDYSRFIVVSPNRREPLSPTLSYSSEFKKLPPEKQKEIVVKLALLKLQIHQEIEAATCPQATVNFWKAQELARQGDFENARVAIKQFLDSDLNSLAFDQDPELKSAKAEYLQKAEKILGKIDQISGANQEFFEAQKLLAAQDLIGAKKLLLQYYQRISQEKPAPNKPDYREPARELLVRICQTQFDQVKAKFKAEKKPDQYLPLSEGEGVPQVSPYFLAWEKVGAQIAKLEDPISAGKYLDFDQAVSEELGGGKFDPHEEFDFIGDELMEGTGKEGLLTLARKYRERGNLILAKAYFERYFRDQLNKLGEVSVTIEQLRLKYDSNPKHQIELSDKIKQAREEYSRRFGPDYLAAHPFDEKAARLAIENEILAQIRPHEIKLKQQELASSLPADLQPIWKEFAQMEGLAAREVAGVTTFAISDEGLHELYTRVPMEIAIIAVLALVSGGTGAVAGRAVMGMRMTEVAAFAAREFGAVSGLRRGAGYAVGTLVEGSVFAGGNAVVQGLEAGRFDFREMFLDQWGRTMLDVGAFGLVGRLGHGLKLGKTSLTSLELSTMGVLHGDVGLKDLVFVLGMKAGHGVGEAFGLGMTPESAREKKSTTERTEKTGQQKTSKEVVGEIIPEDSLPQKSAFVGKKEYSREQFREVSNDRPLDPFPKDSPAQRAVDSLSRTMHESVSLESANEAARQNPHSTPEVREIWQRGFIDGDTGAYNRNGFRFVEKWVEAGKQFAVASFDGDFFGAFNKLKGTAFGDVVIQIMGENFRAVVQKLRAAGKEAILIREGGEEFSLFVEGMSAKELTTLMDQFRVDLQKDIRSKLKQIDPVILTSLVEYLQATGSLSRKKTAEKIISELGDGSGPIGGSTIGVAATPVDLATSKTSPHLVIDALKRHADQALEQGKKNRKTPGRNRVYEAEPLTAAKVDSFVADSSLSRERDIIYQKTPSPAENLQKIYSESREAVHQNLIDLHQVRGWSVVNELILKHYESFRTSIVKILSSPVFDIQPFRELSQKGAEKILDFLEVFETFHQEYLSKISLYDPLTGVLNEQGFQALIQKRAIQEVPVTVYDLDVKLKPVNEVIGHIGGDAYLIASGRALKEISGRVPGIDPQYISISRKLPREGAGFKLTVSAGELSPTQIKFISVEYAKAIEKGFFQRIGAGPDGKSPRDLIGQWIDHNSKSKEEDRAAIGKVSVVRLQ